METLCVITYWKGFVLGVVVGILVPIALIAIGVSMGATKLNQHHERMLERSEWRANVRGKR